jgi:hypothetical protein
MWEFTLTDDDDEVMTVVADSRDVVRWEHTSESDEKYTDLVLTRARSLSRFYRLAHIAARRQGLIDKVSVTDFEKRYRLDVTAQEKPRPTNAEVSPETS